MTRMIAYTLTLMLVAAGAPALAHEANYLDECNDQPDGVKCETDERSRPAHTYCSGDRDAMWGSNTLVQRDVGLDINEETSVHAYIHAPADGGDSEESGDGPGALMPGVVWLETNGFSSLQRSDFSCTQSPNINDDEAWDGHSDRVLI
jgi:hypothetical protein